MERRNTVLAIVVLLVIALMLVVTMNQTLPPGALPASAPATEFSAERAIERIEAIALEPRVIGTPAYKTARDYVLEELTEMGLSPEVQRTTARGIHRLSYVYVPVENVVVRIEGTDTEEAFLLSAHLDSEAFSPGAIDNAYSVATLLETARALQAAPPPRNSVILLFNGPEETGLQGTVAFMAEHPWADEVQLMTVLEAGSFSGPSTLVTTSPENGWLIREFARADLYAAGSSFVQALAEPSSDFSVLLAAGLPGYFFTPVQDRRVDSRLDSIQNLNPRSIQHQGYHALSLARHFGDVEDLEDPKDPNSVNFNLLRPLLVNYPRTWAIPIMLVVALVFAGVLVLGFRRRLLTALGIGLGALVLLLVSVTVLLVVRVLWAVFSGTVPLYQFPFFDHAYNEPLLGVAFILVTVALTATWYALIQKVRRVSIPDLTMGALSFLVLFMVGTSIAMPEMSYPFTWPLLASLLATGFWFFTAGEDPEAFTTAQIVALLLAALVSIVVFVPLVYVSFVGSPTDDAFMVMAQVVALLALNVPLLHIITRPHRWWLPVAAGALAVALLAVVVLDDFDDTKPQLSTAFYVLNADTGEAFWGGGSPWYGDGLDERTAQFFPPEVSKQPIPGFPSDRPYYLADAPAASLPAPQVELVDQSTSGGMRTLHLHFSSPRNASGMLVLADPELDIVSVEVDGASSAPLPFFGDEGGMVPGLLFFYEALQKEGIDAEVEVGGEDPVELLLVDQSFGLPDIPGVSIEPMPDHIMPQEDVSQFANLTAVMKTFTLGGKEE